jgi:hypothetical protein
MRFRTFELHVERGDFALIGWLRSPQELKSPDIKGSVSSLENATSVFYVQGAQRHVPAACWGIYKCDHHGHDKGMEPAHSLTATIA